MAADTNCKKSSCIQIAKFKKGMCPIFLLQGRKGLNKYFRNVTPLRKTEKIEKQGVCISLKNMRCTYRYF